MSIRGLGLVLLAAALLKSHEFVVSSALESRIAGGRALAFVAIMVECILGLSLLSNLYTRPLWWCATCVFTLFSVVSFYKAISGYGSCGCFGKLPVDPWWTFTFDCLALTLLLATRSRASESRVYLRPYRPIIGSALAFGAAVVGTSFLLAPESSLAAIQESEPGSLVILDTEQWVNQPFPLYEFIDDADEIKQGNWAVLLYHHDCPICQSAIDELRQLLSASEFSKRFPRIAFVAMPPFDNATQPEKATLTAWIERQLSPSREWFVEAPALIVIRDGIVLECTNGEDVLTTGIPGLSL